MKLKKETLRWPRDQDKITSRCVHVLGFVYGKQDEMPTRVVVPSSCHRARGTASLCMNTRYVLQEDLQEDCSENDEVFKSTLFFPCGKIFVQLQTCTVFHTVTSRVSFRALRKWRLALRESRRALRDSRSTRVTEAAILA